jgi:hypothetical protein
MKQKPIASDLCRHLFSQAVADYHLADSVDCPSANPFERGDIKHLLYNKTWIDTVQWHLEDIIRKPDIDPVEALAIKRRIDSSNQERTNVVEQLDRYIYDMLVGVQSDNAPLNTETPAWALDRLSILTLKIYHMREESMRIDASDEHKSTCSARLRVLYEQEADLSGAIDNLMDDLMHGRKRMKMYLQMKMYNDPSLNPVLYKK